MADPKGFLKHRQRELPVERPVPVRIMDWKEIQDSKVDNSAILKRQASRCMDCGIPFCHFSCPLGNLIPEWNDLRWRENLPEAIDRLHATNNFPEFTGRLCPAPCESGCVLGINQEPVTIKQVEHSIIDEAWEADLVTPQIPEYLTGKTVAVVGSGPAGLAAAQQLTRAGHTVAVYEKSDAPGGLLRYGIPEFKLEKSVLERRLAQMEVEGTRFYNNASIGEAGHNASELLQGYDAVVLAIGTPIGRDLPVPGREFSGIHQAVEFLTTSTRRVHGLEIEDDITAADKDVVVIGGGDTGSDCIGTSVRQGARSITSLEIMPQASTQRPENWPWPTFPKLYKVSTSMEEGGQTLYSTSTVEFLSDGTSGEGAVSHLRLTDVEFVGGRLTTIEGSERVIPAQLVLLAMGFVGVPNEGIVDQLGLNLDKRARIERNQDFTTNVPGVFVAGDAGRGQSLIVWAIAEGRAAAKSVDSYLSGTESALHAPVRAGDLSLTL
ncbi:glutamate synthase subunit beta [Changpingibacter yushuensis]|uniref:glutamate synthase subunit beta n=1 Tax=Changpingibacter yushuensis TaxID=2758440 RepID=UPI00165E5B69|nr:glutamate synthase subunit beta [Changpingibacter yushuensis]